MEKITDMTPRLYFGYGSNLDKDDWTKWCEARGKDPSGLEEIGPAWLDEYQLVFDYYSKSRGDVTSHQLDDLDNTLTPQEKDNCLQHAAAQVSSDFSDSSLSKRYTKEPTTIKSLGDKLKNLQENRK